MSFVIVSEKTINIMCTSIHTHYINNHDEQKVLIIK